MPENFAEEFSLSATDLLSRLDNLSRARSAINGSIEVDKNVWELFSESGWLSVLVPQKDGGLGLGLKEFCAIAAQAGRNCIPEPYLSQGVQIAVLLSNCKDGDLRSYLLDQLQSGQLIAGLAWQEKIGQIEPDNVQLVAQEKDNQLILNGKKVFVSPAQSHGWIVLAVTANQQNILIWVPSSTAGIQKRTYTAVDGTQYCDLSFNCVTVSTDNILASGSSSKDLVQLANNYARIAIAADLLGVTERALEISIEYVKLRKQFGKPIGTFQALKHKIVDCYIATEISRACISGFDETLQDGESLLSAACRIKARLSDTALFVTKSSIQFHGAIGYTSECDIGIYLKRAMHFCALLGSATELRKQYLDSINVTEEVTQMDEDVEIPQDRDWNALSEADFRKMLKTFFKKNYPDSMRNIQRRLHWDEIKDWTKTLAEQGWLAPAWPKEYGGMGLSPEKVIAFVEEYENYGVARTMDMGVAMVGPLLMKYGTQTQKDRYLPKIVSGQHRWCQGYSEPGAGSDLASLTTRAELRGDHFVVNGQKIWTTLAHNATHMFTLVRTDSGQSKQGGISFLLIDLKTDGITIRPIEDIGGNQEFCEVFLNDVRVPCEDLVGEINKGWSMAKSLLGFERLFLGSPKQGRYAISQLRDLANLRGLFSNPLFHARFAELLLKVEDQARAYTSYADLIKKGLEIPPSISLLKVWGTETYQEICVFMYEWALELGFLKEPYFPDQPNFQPAAILFNALPATIYGGSSQIQREIIAKRVLDIGD